MFLEFSLTQSMQNSTFTDRKLRHKLPSNLGYPKTIIFFPELWKHLHYKESSCSKKQCKETYSTYRMPSNKNQQGFRKQPT